MGLLLSVLVTCVGVVELLTFYHNVTRRVNSQPVQSDLTTVREQYLKELEDVRDRLVVQLYGLKSRQNNFPEINVPTLRLNSHEDVDIELNDKTKGLQESTSPRPLSVTERKVTSSSPTKFAVLKEPQVIMKSKTQECLPDYLIEEQGGAIAVEPKYILQEHGDSASLPLLEKPLISEQGKDVKTDVFRKKLGHNIVELDGEIYYRRSPSPFPSFDLTVPRNSVCSELLDDSVSVAEIEECSRSNSHSPVNTEGIVNAEATCELTNIPEINNNSQKIDVMLQSSTHNSAEFWSNQPLIVPLKKNQSLCSHPVRLEKEKEDCLLKQNFHTYMSELEADNLQVALNMQTSSRIASSLELFKKKDDDLEPESEDENELVELLRYTEEAKSNLDGLDRSKGCIKKKIIRRKRIKNRSTTVTKTDFRAANTSMETTVVPIEKNANTRTIDEKTNNLKPGEPFWVDS